MNKISFMFILFVLNIYITNAQPIHNDLSKIGPGPIPIYSVGLTPGLIYPLTTDEQIKEFKARHPVFNISYPLLVINGVVIRDEEQINYFRNKYIVSTEYKNLKKNHKIKRKSLSQEKAIKKGVKNVPKDGVLLIRTSKNIIVDLYDTGD